MSAIVPLLAMSESFMNHLECEGLETVAADVRHDMLLPLAEGYGLATLKVMATYRGDYAGPVPEQLT
jgi:hypothetical protein